MIRETAILLGILLVLQPSEINAVRCWSCRSTDNVDCADTFINKTFPAMDCRQTHTYDLTPIESCLKIKHKEGDRWVYERGCDRKDKPQFNGEAQFYWCTTDYCNAAENHQPKLLVTLLFASLFLFKLWRF